MCSYRTFSLGLIHIKLCLFQLLQNAQSEKRGKLSLERSWRENVERRNEKYTDILFYFIPFDIWMYCKYIKYSISIAAIYTASSVLFNQLRLIKYLHYNKYRFLLKQCWSLFCNICNAFYSWIFCLQFLHCCSYHTIETWKDILAWN